MTLTLPPDLQSQVEAEARRRGTDAQTVIVEATRARFSGAKSDAQSETREERRARINRAIDEAQATFAHLTGPPFGDAALEMESAKADDMKREIARGL